MRLKFFLPLVLFAALVVVFFSGLWRNPEELPSALIGKPAPEFDLPPLPLPEKDSRPGLKTSDLSGAPGLVNVFASWCIPCKAEHPLLLRLSQSGAVPIYGINYKDKPGDAVNWLQELGNPYTRIGADSDGRVGIDWGVYGVPETFVVDSSGIIRYRHVGPLTSRDLDEAILPLLKSLKK